MDSCLILYVQIYYIPFSRSTFVTISLLSCLCCLFPPFLFVSFYGIFVLSVVSPVYLVSYWLVYFITTLWFLVITSICHSLMYLYSYLYSTLHQIGSCIDISKVFLEPKVIKKDCTLNLVRSITCLLDAFHALAYKELFGCIKSLLFPVSSSLSVFPRAPSGVSYNPVLSKQPCCCRQHTPAYSLKDSTKRFIRLQTQPDLNNP